MRVMSVENTFDDVPVLQVQTIPDDLILYCSCGSFLSLLHRSFLPLLSVKSYLNVQRSEHYYKPTSFSHS